MQKKNHPPLMGFMREILIFYEYRKKGEMPTYLNGLMHFLEKRQKKESLSILKRLSLRFRMFCLLNYLLNLEAFPDF